MPHSPLTLLTHQERDLLDTPGALPPNGFIDAFMDWAARKTDAPRYTLEAAALTALSLAAGDGVVLEGLFSDQPTYMNLYVIVVGPSTVLRKSTVLGYVDGLMPTTISGPLVTTLDDVSPQALNQALAAAGSGKRPVLMAMDEVAGVFEVQKRRGSYLAGLDKVLLKAYDHHPIHVLRARASIDVPTGAFVNVFAASTPEPLYEVLESDDVASGLLPRFLVFDATEAQRGKRRSLKKRAADGTWEEDKERLKDFIEGIAAPTITMQGKPTVVPMTDEALDRFDKLDAVLYHEVGKDSSNYGAMKGRAFWQAFKLSGLYAISRGGRETQVELIDVLRALHTVESCLVQLAEMAEAVGNNKFERKLDEVLTLLTQKGGAAKVSVVARQLKLEWREAADIQRTLEMRGQLTVDKNTKEWRRT